MNLRDMPACEAGWDAADCAVPDTSTENNMNRENPAIPDVQNTTDTRRIAIQQVGVKGVRHPVRIRTGQDVQHTVGTWNLYVQLPDEKKGTHMSRFIAILEEANTEKAPPVDTASFAGLMKKMLAALDATEGRIEVTFPYFVRKIAPVSRVESLMDYQITLACEAKGQKMEIWQKVQVPVTSLCPCSREISAYGAHNQRSHITVNALVKPAFPLKELITKIEKQGSCELYGLLKRPDEKFVTEQAYENPKFVEDLVRDVAGILNTDDRVMAYTLEAENFESIHNHSAYARIEFDKRQ